MKISSVNRTVNLLTQIINIDKPTEAPVEFRAQKPPFCPMPVRQPLPRATPESQGVSSDVLRAFLQRLADDPTINPHQVMILRNGHVIAQTAFGAQEVNTWKYTFSACKSVVSMAIGLLMDEGKLTEQTRVADVFDKKLPALSAARFNDMTVLHLLTMSSGIQFSEIEAMTSDDWLKGCLNSLISGEPGKKFHYNSLNTYVLAAIVREITGQELLDYLRPRLLEPMGIVNVFWEKCPAGIERGGWGMYLCPEDFAKLAQLVMQDGMWNGRQLISAAYLRRATDRRIAVPEEFGDFDYGFQFWSGRKHRCFLMNGMLGQNAVGFRDSGIVAVINAGNYDMFQTNEFFRLAQETFGGTFPEKLDGNLSAFLRLRRTIDAFTPGRPGPRLFRKSELPPECAELDGLTLIPDRDGSAASTGLLPLAMQVISGNYTAGLAGIRFRIADRTLYLEYHEADEVHTLPIGFQSPAFASLIFHGEPQRAAVSGAFARDEDDRLVLKLRIDLLELPSTRFLQLYFYRDHYELLHFEAPDEGLILTNAPRVTNSLDDVPFIGTALTKITTDWDYFDYMVKRLFRPRIRMKKSDCIPPVKYGD
jgi:CubicO group peptidase (beta-lactamase class C family)